MKMIKSLVLGSAAGLLAMSGAQAADLPVKAKAVEYVKVCSLYGAGFYYIPGTDTCIKLGGYLRVDVLGNTNSDDTGNIGPYANNRYTNAYTWRSREDLNIDTRTATEYGVVRTFWDATFSWTTGDGVAQSDPVGLYYAFIQFAGFTMGKAISQFSAPWTAYPANIFDGLVGGGGDVTGVNQFSYTADFGQGVSATISAQDQSSYYQAGTYNVSGFTAAGLAASPLAIYGTNGIAGGTAAPDIVGMIRVDQAWGLFQASGAAHLNHAGYYSGIGTGLTSGLETAGHPDDVWGWAGQLALSIKNIPTGPGDTINIQAVYTDGATRYNIQDLASQAGAAAIYGGSSVAYQSLGIGFAPDTVFGTGTSQQLVQTWGMRGGYTHNWDPHWASSIYGAYAAINYNGASKALICANVAGQALLTTCNPDYSIGQLGFTTSWTPVKGLSFTGDVTWTQLSQNYAGLLTAGNTAIGKPNVAYEMKNQDTVLFMLRAQRNW